MAEKIFLSRDLFADVMSVHNRNMKHAHAIEFLLNKFTRYVIMSDNVVARRNIS